MRGRAGSTALSLPAGRARRSTLAAAIVLSALVSGCAAGASPSARVPSALLREARPIGAGARFRPPAIGPTAGRCTPTLGVRSEVHVELFAADRVVIVAAGIGAARPRALADGRLTHARCYGDVVTLEPTGVVLVRPRAHLRLAALFRAWGQPLSPSRVASFRAGRGAQVSAYVDGRRWVGAPGSVPLRAGEEIVLEVGQYVPPHRSYVFAPTQPPDS